MNWEDRSDLYMPDVADSNSELDYLSTQAVEALVPLGDPIWEIDEANVDRSSIESNSDSDSSNDSSPLATVLNRQPSQSRLITSTVLPPNITIVSPGVRTNTDDPPLATAPGHLSRVRKQTRSKESQNNREAVAAKLKGQKKVK